MSHPNLLLRDPVMYRIRRAHHYRRGDAWCLYPTYDWAHGQSDSIEGITHSICTLEFEVHRPLYDWFLTELGIHHPRQIEFARLYLSHTVLSKRKLLALVKEGIVDGWDDPRMPTISAHAPPGLLRRRRSGSLPARRGGQGPTASSTGPSWRAASARSSTERSARAMAVLRPLKVVLTNYPEDRVEMLDCVNNPEDPSAGTRQVPFARELYIERDDFLEDPPKKFFRLSPGREVRLRYAYFITCTEVVKDPATGEVVELRCTYDPATRGGDAPDGRSPKATLHWVSAAHAVAGRSPTLRHAVQRSGIRASWKKGRTGNPTSIRPRSKSSPTPGSSRCWTPPRQPLSVRAAGVFYRRLKQRPGPRSSTGR